MQLFYFLFVMLSLACGSLPASEHHILPAIGFTILMVIAWWVLCHLAARMVAGQVKQDSLDPLDGAKWIEKQLTIFRWLSLAIIVLCLGGFGVGRNLDSIPILSQSRALQAIVLLVPGILILTGTWSADYSYGVRLGYVARGWKARVKDIWSTFRVTLSWLVGPVIALLMMVDFLDHFSAFLHIDSEITQSVLLLGAVSILVLFLVPVIIRKLFPTEPMHEGTEAWIREVMLAVGIKKAKPVRWRTGGTLYNAMVAGFIGRFRTVLVSDRLLDELPREQTAMVILHEAAHLKRFHLPLRIASLIPVWLIGLGATQLAHHSSQPYLADSAELLGAIATITMTLVALRIVSYWTEFDADAMACRLAEDISGKVDHVPTSACDAARELSSALQRVTFGNETARRASWLHPSIDARVSRMKRKYQPDEALTAKSISCFAADSTC